jgi:hypothetical protein
LVGKKKQQEAPKLFDSGASGKEVDHRERMGADGPLMVEGQKYVRHPEDDATFLVSSTQKRLW